MIEYILIHFLIGCILYLLTCFYIYHMLFNYATGILKDYSHKTQNNISLYIFTSWFLVCVFFSFKCLN